MKFNRKWLFGILLAVALLAAWLVLSKKPNPTSANKVAPNIATYKISTGGSAGTSSFDGVIESARQSVIAAQVAGNVLQINVRAGDRVKAGQTLLRIDGQAAEQAAIAARAEYERQVMLYNKQYISKAALDQAKVQMSAATAQSGFFIIKAPFSGVISDVNAKLGEMAMPGMPLLQMFDPSVMRVSAQVPQSQLAQVPNSATARIELSGMSDANQWLVPASMEVLPAVDARTHSGTIRLPLNKTNIDLVPGTFARVWMELPANVSPSNPIIWVPSASVMRRGEMNAVYVKSAQGMFLLRQVRIGQTQGDKVQILTGLSADEEIAIDPQAAASAEPAQ